MFQSKDTLQFKFLLKGKGKFIVCINLSFTCVLCVYLRWAVKIYLSRSYEHNVISRWWFRALHKNSTTMWCNWMLFAFRLSTYIFFCILIGVIHKRMWWEAFLVYHLIIHGNPHQYFVHCCNSDTLCYGWDLGVL